MKTPCWRSAIGATLLLGAGCATLQQMSVPASEAGDYRRARSADTFEERLSFTWLYLERYPEGAYAQDLKPWFAQNEGRFLARNWTTLEGLTTYLAVLPEGPHASEAREKARKLEQEQARWRAKQAANDAAAAVQLAELESAEEGRKALLRQLAQWVELVATVQCLGKSPQQLPVTLQAEFVSGGCSALGCRKSVKIPYSVPARGQRVMREVELTFGYELGEQGVQRMYLRGAGLFTAVAEASTLELVEDASLQQRAEAISSAVGIVSNLVEPRLPAQSCAVEAVAPVVLARRCGGAGFDAVAGTGAAPVDVLELRSVPAASDNQP